MRRLALLLLIASALLVSCNYQKHKDHYLDESFQAVIEAEDGGVLAVGAQTPGAYVTQENVADGDYYERGTPSLFFTRTDNSGNKRWERGTGIGLRSFHLAVNEQSGNGFTVAGFAAGSNTAFFVHKIDASGTDQWHRTLNDNLGSNPAVCATPAGGFAFAGCPSAQPVSLRLVIVDAEGNAIVQRSYPRADSMNAYSTEAVWISAAGDGFVISAYGQVLKVSAEGDSLWNFPAVTDSQAIAITAGRTDGSAVVIVQNERSHAHTIRIINSDGSAEPARDFSFSSSEPMFFASATMPGNETIITGAASAYWGWHGLATYGICLPILGASGELATEYYYATESQGSGQAVAVTRDGGFMVGGSTGIHHHSSFGTDAIVFRTDATGHQLWSATAGQ